MLFSFRKIASCVVLFSIFVQTSTLFAQNLGGFSSANSSKQKDLEKTFDSVLKAENLRDWMKRLSARPHHVGSDYGKANAEFMLSLFKSWGFDAQLERFDVLFPTPKTRVLEMTSPENFTAKLDEPVLKEDATSDQKSEQLPTYNAYSIDGDVTGDVVYVNYGIPSDYDELEQRGIDVKGKIVIARYGGSWRGIKPKVAAEHGAIACLIYSDPKNDGFYQGDVYPKGAWRQENGVQRGSVADMPLFPGDPTTPNIASTANAKRLDLKNAPTLTKIPVMPISYGDALPILRNLNGVVVPDAWRGALPITYKFGGVNSVKVHFKLAFNWDIKPIYDVVAKLPGTDFPDQWIIRGNHHDAWVNGASDPISGLVSLLEEARGVSELTKTGWKPKRTIVYCAWDGEEPGLLGSTEWAELHAEELSKKAAVYINSDSNGRGYLGVGGSHTLEKFVNEVAKDVNDPEKNVSAWKRWQATDLVYGSPTAKKEAKERSDLRIDALGSGSDFTPFLQHLGIASLNVGYGGEDGGGSYHSIYDSFDHYTRFGDPNFQYGIALSQTCGRMTLRLANAEVLPFEFTNFADTLNGYIKELVILTDSMRATTNLSNQYLDDGTFNLVQDPKQTYIPPKKLKNVPTIDFTALQKALAKVNESAKNFQKALNGKEIPADKQKQINEILYKSERALLNQNGLPKRDWFKHQIYAPGFYTGYGVKTLPSIRESIEQRDWSEAEKQIKSVAQTLENFASEIDKATDLLKK
jgi:N-acetylated-alpha-linked acidic dipeptidase